jgi:hypothetical protein
VEIGEPDALRVQAVEMGSFEYGIAVTGKVTVARMAYRTRVPGPRSLRISQRSGKPITGRRETGGTKSQRERVRDGRLPEPSGCRLTGELIDTETVPISSERGGWKSACEGNSLAAYSTSRPVL